MNIAFYTYFYGSDNNPSFRIPECPSTKYKCYYYTNNKNALRILENTSWIGIFHDRPTNDDLIESCMVGKYIKTQPYDFEELKNYDYLCYFDTKLPKVNESFIEEYIQKYFIEQDYALLIREHWGHLHCGPLKSVIDEYNESMLQYRYQLESEKYKVYIKSQLDAGLSHSTPNHVAGGFLIRNMKHPIMKQIDTTWYEHIQKCGIQDQISLFFVKQYYMKYIHPFTQNPYI